LPGEDGISPAAGRGGKRSLALRKGKGMANMESGKRRRSENFPCGGKGRKALSCAEGGEGDGQHGEWEEEAERQ